MNPNCPASARVPACVIHCRVSTVKQAYEGESLDVQADLCVKIARDNGWKIAHEPWKESFSGRKAVRPAFEDVLAFLDTNPGLVQYYLFRSIDRATRGGSFSYEQMKRALMQRGVEMTDSYGIIQPVRNTLQNLGFEYDWSLTSPSEIAEVVVATSAKNDLTGILTRLIGQEITLRQRGYKVRPPVDGFTNERVIVDGRKRVIEKADPERARYLIAMFELRALGQLTDLEICERVNAMGYRTRVYNRWDRQHRHIVGHAGGHPLNTKHLQEIICRPIYCGLICEKWTYWKPVKAMYDGLVSIETFNAANRGKVFIRRNSDADFELLRGAEALLRATKRSKENPLFPLRKVILCNQCRKPLLGSSPRGSGGKHFPTYHCARRHAYFGVSKAVLEGDMARYIAGLRFRCDARPAMQDLLLAHYHQQEELVAAADHDVQRKVEELELRKAEAIKAFSFASLDAMRRGLEAEVERLDRQLADAHVTHGGLAMSKDDIGLFIADALMIMEHPSILLENPVNSAQFEALYGFTFEELPTYAEIVSGTAKLAWIFRLFSNIDDAKSEWVHPPILEWNTVHKNLLNWKKLRGDHPSLLDPAWSVGKSLKSPRPSQDLERRDGYHPQA